MLTSLAARRARVARALPLEREIVLVGAVLPFPLPENTDQTYPFRAHTEYVYLAGLECPGAVLAYDPLEGPELCWKSSLPEVTEEGGAGRFAVRGFDATGRVLGDVEITAPVA